MTEEEKAYMEYEMRMLASRERETSLKEAILEAIYNGPIGYDSYMFPDGDVIVKASNYQTEGKDNALTKGLEPYEPDFRDLMGKTATLAGGIKYSQSLQECLERSGDDLAKSLDEAARNAGRADIFLSAFNVRAEGTDENGNRRVQPLVLVSFGDSVARLAVLRNGLLGENAVQVSSEVLEDMSEGHGVRKSRNALLFEEFRKEYGDEAALSLGRVLGERMGELYPYVNSEGEDNPIAKTVREAKEAEEFRKENLREALTARKWIERNVRTPEGKDPEEYMQNYILERTKEMYSKFESYTRSFENGNISEERYVAECQDISARMSQLHKVAALDRSPKGVGSRVLSTMAEIESRKQTKVEEKRSEKKVQQRKMQGPMIMF